jgi:hypothetical protein
MYSTREIIKALAEANPNQRIDEERIRRAIRRGAISPPSTVAGRFVWTQADLKSLANALGLQSSIRPEVRHA